MTDRQRAAEAVRKYLEFPASACYAFDALQQHAASILAALEQSPVPPIEARWLAEYQTAMIFAVRELLQSLPKNRDWFNPDAERIFKEYLSDATNAVAAQPSQAPVDDYRMQSAETILRAWLKQYGSTDGLSISTRAWLKETPLDAYGKPIEPTVKDSLTVQPSQAQLEKQPTYESLFEFVDSIATYARYTYDEINPLTVLKQIEHRAIELARLSLTKSGDAQ